MMKTSYDIIVAGGGPAGCAAAIAAAREGAKVLLLEQQYCLGGMSTSGMVPAFAPFTDRVQLCSAGLSEELIERYKKRYNLPCQDDEWGWVTISPEVLKTVYDDMMIEAGVDVRFGSFVCSVEREDSRVTGVTVAGKNGLVTYTADVYVDATGDGDVAAFAGAEFEKGDSEGQLQGASLCFAIANVNMDALKNVPYLNAANPDSPIYEMIQDERYPYITDDHFCYNVVGNGTLGFNAGHIWSADNEDALDLSQKMMLGRKKAHEYRRALAEYYPEAFGESVVCATGTVFGLRESRRIIGDYVLSAEDYLARRNFSDEIARGCYYIDIHPSGDGALYKNQDHSEQNMYQAGESYGIPYRCLIPKGFDNLLTCGRIISCDRVIYGSVRVMPNCFTTGQAAGTAAAMAVQRRSTRDIDIIDLRNRLRSAGAYIK